MIGVQTLRRWLEPMYMNPDGSGFGRTWELSLAGPYSIYAKDGAINGYTALIQLVPALGVAFLSLAVRDRGMFLSV